MAEPKEPTTAECLRCLWVLGRREGKESPGHAPHCPFRDAGKDPDEIEEEATSG